MAYVSINDEYLTDIGDAIRMLNNMDITYRPKDMPEVIRDLGNDSNTARVYIEGGLLQDYTNNRITNIRNYGFAGMGTYFASATFENVIEVGDFAFSGCNALQTISLPKATEFSKGLFYNCFALKTFNLSNATIVRDRAFSGTRLEILDLPNITFADNNSFNGMEKVKKIRLSNLTSMGDWNFSDCPYIKALILPGDTIPSIVAQFSSGPNAGLFLDGTEIKEDAFIYVPSSKVSAYKSHSYWGQFYSDKIRAIEDYPDLLEDF